MTYHMNEVIEINEDARQVKISEGSKISLSKSLGFGRGTRSRKHSTTKMNENQRSIKMVFLAVNSGIVPICDDFAKPRQSASSSS
jgi:hypothetical protein